MTHRYDDIINTPWPRPGNRARMDLRDRAAQFAPFAALTGFDGVIRETARLTDAPVYLTEESREALDRALNAIYRSLSRQPEVCLTVFEPDERKDGGAFRELRGRVKKLDLCEGGLVLTDGRKVPFCKICRIETADQPPPGLPE